MGPKAIQFQNWLHAVWRDGDIDKVRTLLNQDSEAHGHMVNSGGALADFEAYIPAMQSIIDNTCCTILRSMETEDWLSCVLEVTGTAHDTGTEIRFFGQVMARFEQGKIVEIYNQFDKAKLLEQLDLIPKESFGLMLARERPMPR